MKKVINYSAATLLLVIFLTACNSAKTMYDQGNYYEAVMRSVEKLRKSPNNKNAKETLVFPTPILNVLLCIIRSIFSKNERQLHKDVI